MDDDRDRSRTAYVVVERRPDGRWARQKSDARRAASLHATQAEAADAARAQAVRERIDVVVKGRDGLVTRRESYRGGDMTELTRESDAETRQKASQTAATAAEQGKQVAESASESAKQVAQTAKEQASHVMSEATDQGKNLIHEATGQLSEQARAQTAQFSQAVQKLSDQTLALAEGRVSDAGPVGEYTRQAATTLSDFATRVNERGFDGLIDDVQGFARRRPVAFLLGAAAAGFVVGRMFRGAATAKGQTAAAAVPRAIGSTAGRTPELRSPQAEFDIRDQETAAGAMAPSSTGR
jgi:hypothetical protein